MTTPEERRILMAEKVMEWKLGKWGVSPIASCSDVWIRDGEVQATCIGWRPLESWADAGRVIDRMHDLGFRLVLESGPDDNDVMFVGKDGEGRFVKAISSIKWAISLAALRALGVEVE